MEYQIKNKISMPRYQQIAVEIATRIANEEYKVSKNKYSKVLTTINKRWWHCINIYPN